MEDPHLCTPHQSSHRHHLCIPRQASQRRHHATIMVSGSKISASARMDGRDHTATVNHAKMSVGASNSAPLPNRIPIACTLIGFSKVTSPKASIVGAENPWKCGNITGVLCNHCWRFPNYCKCEFSRIILT